MICDVCVCVRSLMFLCVSGVCVCAREYIAEKSEDINLFVTILRGV